MPAHLGRCGARFSFATRFLVPANEKPLDPLTIVFALVAVLVIWKLNSVLGRNTGFQGPRVKARGPARPKPAPRNDNVVRLPGLVTTDPVPHDPERWKASLDAAAEAGAADGLDAVAAADSSFSAAPFLDGARTAYEAIITAFAAGERRTLQSLLARDVYDGFDTALRDREKRRETLATTFVSIADAKVGAASLEGRTARIGVRFRSKQISATHGAEGQLAGGSPDHVVDVNDIWTFARDTASRDPNWKLVATQSGD